MSATLWGLLLTAALLPAASAVADEASSADANKSWAEKHISSYYLNWLTGMHTEALDGNRDGTGTALEDDHFFAIGPRLSKHTSLTVSFWGQQFIDEDDSHKKFNPGDPYLTLFSSQILHSDLYAANLDGYLRYYIPVSRNTSDALNKGTIKDYGHGMVRVYLAPSKSWFDGKLTFNGNILANYYFNALSPDERFRRSTLQAAVDGKTVPSSYRTDMYVLLDPVLDYSVNPKLDIYLEWASGYLRHYTSGVVTDQFGTHDMQSRWSSSGHPTDGNYLSPGLYWAPTKKVFVNPYLSYQLSAVNDASAVKRRVNLWHADVGLQVQYTFF